MHPFVHQRVIAGSRLESTCKQDMFMAHVSSHSLWNDIMGSDSAAIGLTGALHSGRDADEWCHCGDQQAECAGTHPAAGEGDMNAQSANVFQRSAAMLGRGGGQMLG